MSIESQRARASLRESEEHYRAVAEAATDAIITIDSNSTILIVNPATERIFGYSTEEMIDTCSNSAKRKVNKVQHQEERAK